MAYLSDYEKRILFSALAREKEVCKDIDKDSLSKEIPLTPIVESLERKFYYDRFEKEIRAKAIDEFTERLKRESFSGYATLEDYFEDAFESVAVEDICRIAEEMKGEQHG